MNSEAHEVILYRHLSKIEAEEILGDAIPLLTELVNRVVNLNAFDKRLYLNHG